MKKTAFGSALYAAALTGAAIIGGAVAYAAPAHAQESGVSITSEIQVERTVTDKSGNSKTVLTDPSKVVITPGEKLLIRVDVANNSAAPVSGLKANNPMPGSVTFISVNEDWAEVSVDGGTTFGKLGELKVKAEATATAPAALRPALPEDVTNVRWTFNDAIAPGTKRSVAFHGIVK